MDMDDLQNIQGEVTELEQNAHATLERLQDLHEKLEKLQRPEGGLAFDIENIEQLSRSIPFSGHPLCMNPEAARDYILALLHIVCVDKDSNANRERLAFIRWLQKQAALSEPLGNLSKNAYQMKVNQYARLNRTLLDPSLRDVFLVDALLVSNMHGAASLEVLKYISMLAAVLDVDRMKMEVLASVSRWILCGNAGSINFSLKKEAEQVLALPLFSSYKEYIKEIQTISSKTVEKVRHRGVHQHRRTLLLRIPVCDGFVWNKPGGEYVGYGTMIAKYPNQHWIKADAFPVPQGETDHYVLVYSTGSGILFQYTSQGYNYGVVSDKDDSLDAIRQWVKNNRSR